MKSQAEELEDTMPQREFVRWQAFEQLEPWGTAIEDSRFAKLLAAEHGGHPLEHFPPRDDVEREAFEAMLAEEREKQRAAQIEATRMVMYINSMKLKQQQDQYKDAQQL